MAWKHLEGLMIVLIVLWLVWFFTGGPSRSQDAKPFINPPAPINNGQTYGPR